MQLLGLYLNDMPKAVSKVLHKGWYPFGAYKRPLASKLVIMDDVMRNAHRVISARRATADFCKLHHWNERSGKVFFA